MFELFDDSAVSCFPFPVDLPNFNFAIVQPESDSISRNPLDCPDIHISFQCVKKIFLCGVSVRSRIPQKQFLFTMKNEKWRKRKRRKEKLIQLNYLQLSFRLQIKRYETGEWNKEFTAFLTHSPERVAKTYWLNGFHLISATHFLCPFNWKRISPLG